MGSVDFLLTKLLPPLVYPLGSSLLLALVALGAVAAGRRRLALLAGSVGATLLWVAAMPWSAMTLAQTLQADYERVPAEAMPSADAILVLGGILGPAHSLEASNLSGAVDRLVFAKRLFAAGKAPHVVVAGGSGEGWLPEADLMAELLVEWGVPRSAILLETESRSTRQNALWVQPLLASRGLGSVLLVTSATHMRRAEASLRAVGLRVVAAPTDFVGDLDQATLQDWLPDPAALELTTRCLKEYLGLHIYRWRGWAIP